MAARRRKALEDLPSDPYESAKVAGLRYVTAGNPGIVRQRKGDGFVYSGTDGKPVQDETTLARIKSLAIPPAWENVWICPSPNGHLQAVGRDEEAIAELRNAQAVVRQGFIVVEEGPPR